MKINLTVLFTGILLVFFLSHFPFFYSDPDINISISRGANTDEGLYSFQVWNYINHKDLTFHWADGVLKNPLFSFITYFPYRIWGTKLIVGKATVLIGSLIILFLVFLKQIKLKKLFILLAATTLSSYYVYHFFHYALADILSSLLILSSIVYLCKRDEIKYVHLFNTSLLLFLSYCLKLQFLYVIVIPTAILIANYFVQVFKDSTTFKKTSFSILLPLFLLGLYYLGWVIPNQDFFTHVMTQQTGDKFGTFNSFYEFALYIRYKEYLFLTPPLKLFTIFFLFTFPLGVIIFLKTKNSFFKRLFLGSSIWLLIESHKLVLDYLPTRYYLSLLIPMGLLISLVLFIILEHIRKHNSNIHRSVFYLILGVISFYNLYYYTTSFTNRTYVIETINHYFGNYNLKNETILGPWAGALSYSTKAKTAPVWNNYFNDKKTLTRFSPKIIITEKNEEDNGGVFRGQNINLNNISDSVRTFKVNHWDLSVYWINKSKCHN